MSTEIDHNNDDDDKRTEIRWLNKSLRYIEIIMQTCLYVVWADVCMGFLYIIVFYRQQTNRFRMLIWILYFVRAIHRSDGNPISQYDINILMKRAKNAHHFKIVYPPKIYMTQEAHRTTNEKFQIINNKCLKIESDNRPPLKITSKHFSLRSNLNMNITQIQHELTERADIFY